MEYPSDSSSDSESDHEDVQDNTDVQDYPELSLVDDLRTSLTITERGGWYLFCFIECSIKLLIDARSQIQYGPPGEIIPCLVWKCSYDDDEISQMSFVCNRRQIF